MKAFYRQSIRIGLSVVASNLFAISSTPRSVLGARSFSPFPNASPSTPATPKLGDYVELDDSIKNDIYGTIDFPNAELKDIVKAISHMAGKNFILDRKIEGKRISILSPETVTKQQAYNAFLSALYMNDLTIVSLGKFLKIVETRTALQSNIRVFTGDYAPASEEVVTVLYKLQYLNAEEINKFLTDLVPRSGRITSYPNTNTLVMTDTGLNLRRVISILKSIDIAGTEDQLESVAIRYASAKGIASMIEEILGAQNGGLGSPNVGGIRRSSPRRTRGGGTITKIVPDERTNTLVVLANGRGIQELKSLVSALDTPNAAAGGIHVYYCRNAIADELASTLNSLVNGQKQGNAAANPARPIPGMINPMGGPINTKPNDGSEGGVSLDGSIKVTADKATNSLVIVASGSDYSALKQVIQKLDIPRRQVYVEATIMEIAAGNHTKFGVVTNYAAGGYPRLGGFMPDTGPTVQSILDPSTLTGVVAGFAAGQTVQVTPTPGGTPISIRSVTGLLQALQTTTQTQILNQPQILTSDNQEAEISINNRVATTTTTTTATTTGTVATPNVSKEDVIISLKLTPQISEENDLVKLKVEQSLDDFADATKAPGQIDVTKRKANTTVTVRDGDTVVVGGLQKDNHQDKRSKIPLLGELPIIGWLFKGKSSEVTKSNLVLFLTPHIINEYKDIIKITGQKIDDREQLSKSLRDPKDLMPEVVAKYKKINEDDMKKPKPTGWARSKKSDSPEINSPESKPSKTSGIESSPLNSENKTQL